MTLSCDKMAMGITPRKKHLTKILQTTGMAGGAHKSVVALNADPQQKAQALVHLQFFRSRNLPHRYQIILHLCKQVECNTTLFGWLEYRATKHIYLTRKKTIQSQASHILHKKIPKLKTELSSAKFKSSIPQSHQNQKHPFQS